VNRRLFAALSFIALGTSCKIGSPTAGTIAFSGTWTLRTVNNSALPFTLGATQMGTLAILSTTVAVDANGTFTSSSTTRETIGATSTNTTANRSGTWTRYNSAVGFKDSADGITRFGTWNQESLKMVDGAFTFVYRK
jgi:hypothetical protein